MGLREVIISMAMKALNIIPASDNTITITEPLSYNMNVLKNRIWYRGDPSELDQFFKQSARDLVGKSRFWAAVPSADSSIRKFHSGLPGEIVDKLRDIIVADLDSIDLESEELTETWNEISKENRFQEELLGDAIIDTLVDGDGAFKISIDTDISEYPIIEFYSGSDVDYTLIRGRLQEVKFYQYYTHKKDTYKLEEIYGRGKIEYKLYGRDNKEVPMSKVPELSDKANITFTGDFIMAVPMRFFKSAKFNTRGRSLFDRKSDNFDALDETISQWIDAIRAGRVKNYIPEDLIPKNPDNGQMMTPNPFDNQFIKIGTSMKEGANEQIDQVQAEINYDAFINTYSSTLDMCLQGIISPSTLGIDLKKTDNAEAQREKEKTTLYTRGKIIDVLNEVIPLLVETVFKVLDNKNEENPKDYEVSISFGEYAAPSFDSVVEAVGNAKLKGIMSIETCVQELYGDTWTDEEKAAEILRLKTEGGLYMGEEPKISDGDLEDVGE